MKLQERIENNWYAFKHRNGYLILWFSLLDFFIESIAQITNFNSNQLYLTRVTQDSTSTE